MNPLSPREKILVSVLSLVALTTALAACKPAALWAEGQPDQLSACQAKLKEWEDWGATNVPKHEALLKENRELEAQLKEQDHDPFWFLIVGVSAFGVGAGVYCLRMLRGFIKRIRPFSLARKRLSVLLSAAAWVTLMVLAHGAQVSRHPIDALAAVLLTSLPALLLAGIMFWWFMQGEGQSTS